MYSHRSGTLLNIEKKREKAKLRNRNNALPLEASLFLIALMLFCPRVKNRRNLRSRFLELANRDSNSCPRPRSKTRHVNAQFSHHSSIARSPNPVCLYKSHQANDDVIFYHPRRNCDLIISARIAKSPWMPHNLADLDQKDIHPHPIRAPLASPETTINLITRAQARSPTIILK